MKMLVAEIGNNHLGSLERLHELTAAAVGSKIEGITLQIREDAYYLQPNKTSRLTDLQYAAWCEYIKSTDKKVGLAICEVNHLDIFDCDFYKILSKDYFNKDLVRAALRTGKPVYISTGDIEKLDDLYLWSDYNNAHFIHTEFSPYNDDVNLRLISRMQMRVGDRVGFGRHCYDINVLAAAVGFEPETIWFYIRDENDKQPDFHHAVPLPMLEAVSTVLQDLRKALGNGIKMKKARKM
jgi:sialic acid synthase SpsE